MSTTATIVGIGVTPEEVLQDDGDRTERLFVTPAFTRRARPYTYSVVGLVLRHGDRDIAAVKERTTRLLPPGTVEFRVTSVDAFKRNRHSGLSRSRSRSSA